MSWLITAAPASYQLAGRLLYFAPVFLLFYLTNLRKTAEAVWRHICQDVGPDWKGRARMLNGYPSRGFSRGSEKLSIKYTFSDNFFRPKTLYNGEAHE